MMGLGPHEMGTGLSVIAVCLTLTLALAAVVAVFVATWARAARARWKPPRRTHLGRAA